MNLQALVDGMSAQWQRERAETQITLGKLIEALEAMAPDDMVANLNAAHSYRGYYSDLAFERGESLADLEANTLTEDDMAKEFDSGYGGTEGVPFTAWTAKTVYFPICYDGAEWVGSVSRHPDGKQWTVPCNFDEDYS